MRTATRKVPPKGRKRPAGIKELRRRHGMSQALTARLLGVSLRTLSVVESGTNSSTLVRRNVLQLGRLLDALGEAMDPGHVGRWVDEPNDMLGGLKPVEAVERGQLDLVWQIANGLRTGSPL